MRLTTALSGLLLLTLVACASAPRRPTSAANRGQKTLFDRCAEAQQTGSQPPVACPAANGSSTQQSRTPPNLPSMPRLPSGLGTGGVPGAGSGAGGIFR